MNISLFQYQSPKQKPLFKIKTYRAKTVVFLTVFVVNKCNVYIILLTCKITTKEKLTMNQSKKPVLVWH